MIFKELPKEIQSFILSCSMLMDKVDMAFDDDLIQDDYNIKQRLTVCQQKYEEMKRILK